MRIWKWLVIAGVVLPLASLVLLPYLPSMELRWNMSQGQIGPDQPPSPNEVRECLGMGELNRQAVDCHGGPRFPYEWVFVIGAGLVVCGFYLRSRKRSEG